MHGTIHLFDCLPQVEDRPAVPRWAPVTRATPLVGVIRNPRSHRGGKPMPRLAHAGNILVEVPSKRSELKNALGRFAERRVDYLVIDGGDGTVRDVLTCGAGIFGECWPTIILLASGKTNALAHDLGLPRDWRIEQALDDIASGSIVTRRPMVVSQKDQPSARVLGYALGAGAFTTAVELGQSVHRWGAFNSLAVGLTAFWSLAQALFGSKDNALRRGTALRLRDGAGRPLPHSGTSPEDERYLLFASTLENMPAGMQPFKPIGAAPIRGMLLDSSRRRLLAALPRLIAGKSPANASELGIQLFGGDGFELDIRDRFILDGEAFPAGRYRIGLGPKLRFLVP